MGGRNGVGSRFRPTIYHMGSGSPENDSRPLPPDSTKKYMAGCLFELDNPFVVVTVSSLTDAPIATSERLLVTTVARAQNTGFQSTEQDGRIFIRAHGGPSPSWGDCAVAGKRRP